VIDQQGLGAVMQGTEPQKLMPGAPRIEDRMRELEAENSRLKSLVGELLIVNQLLREDRDRRAIS
jgi:hypothetical protein